LDGGRRAVEKALKDVESRLRNRPTSLELRFERVRLLDRLGRVEEARRGYVDILQADPDHFGALTNLGMLLFRAGAPNDALTCFNAAAAKHPRNAAAQANLGFMLLRAGDAAAARERYQTAVELDASNAEARRGLALALGALGETVQAQAHRDAGFRTQPVMQLPFRGQGRPVRLLSIVSASAGNAPVERFFDDRTFAVSKVVAEYCRDTTPLPGHDLVFNAVGDADAAAPALRAAQAIVARSSAPVLNRPENVLSTARAANAVRLRDVEGVVAPLTATIAREAFAGTARIAADRLTGLGFGFPLLLRSPGYHAGANFERVESAGELAAVAQRLPGDELLAIQFVDTRGSDGRVRKYRMMFVGGKLYPLHLAVASQWKVHYFSADMDAHPERRREEERFLCDPAATLGSNAMEALQRVCDLLGLAYAGADFSLDATGKPIVFEANATMIVAAASADPNFAYRRPAIEKIESAVRQTLLETVTPSRRAE
jgi:tetratricopeptide (TPR) repeat protein